MSKEAMKLALDALEPRPGMPNPEHASLRHCAITALREALAEQSAQQEPLTDEQKRELIKKSALWDMHIHIGWYSAPAKSFVEKATQLISDIEAAHGIGAKP